MSSADDFDQGEGPVVVDFDVLERAKENVQPLATGRRVTALAGLLQTPHAQREAKLLATRNRLRINVELALEDEDGDPLEAYCRLVYWTVENYPQGHSAESGLLELLEEATRVLKDHAGGVYRGELKYLKLWLLYASYVDKPTIIYRFMLANDIGTEFALLYEEHAAVLERDGRKKEADEIYGLGLARKAQPLEHLKARYEDFQKRMMTNTSIPVVEPSRPTPQQAPRQALATTSSLPTSSSRPLGSANTQAPPIPSSSSNARMQIFFDPTGEEAEAPTGSEWKELDARKTRVKENVPETKKLAGATIKQPGRAKRIASAASGASGSSSSKIVPYRDTDAGEMPPSALPASRSTGAATRSTRTASGSSVKAKVPAKGGFAIFSDAPEAAPAPGVARASASKARAPAKGGFAVAIDPKPASTPAASRIPVSKAPGHAKGRLAVHVDAPEAGPSSAAASKAKAPIKPAFAVHADTPEEEAVSPATTATKFTPFRDEDEDAPPKATAVPVGESIIKVKKAGLQAPVPTSEAEALRKDPLKNYATNDDGQYDD